MLELLVGEEPLDLLPDTGITIEEESPVFDKDSIPGGFSFPFSLPITPRNRRILNFPERIEKSGRMSVNQPCSFFHDGKLRAQGTISVTEAGSEYKASITVNSGDLASKIKDLKLKDVNLGGKRTWQWKPEYKYPEDDFTVAPLFNTIFYKDTPLADSFAEFYYRVNPYESGRFDVIAGTVVFVTSPFPFLSYIVRQIFSTFGFGIIENVLLSDPDFRDLVVYTNRDISSFQIAYNHANVCIGLDGSGNPLYRNIQTGAYADRTILPYDLADSMPDMRIGEFLLSIRNFLNLAFITEGNSVRIIKRKDLIQKSVDFDITQQAIGTPVLLSVTSAGFKLEWTTDPDDSLWGEDTFKRIDDFLSFVKAPLSTADELETLEPTPNEIRYIIDVDIFFRYVYFAYDPDDETKFRWQWVSWSFNYQNYRVGDASEVFSSSFAPILMVTSRHSDETGLMRCPFLELKGNYPAKPDIAPFALRLMFYRGMTEDSLGNLYPYCTNDNLTRTGLPLTGKNLTLRFDGESGIYNQLWKYYMAWWTNRKQVNWVIRDPSTLSFHQKYAIDGKHYLLKKRSMTFWIDAIQPAECEFYLV